MANSLKYCLSLFILTIILSSCIELSNETFHKLSIDERRKLSADYTQLAKRLETGSPKYMRILEKAIRINPDNDLAWRELSLPYLYSGMTSEWHKHIQKAIDLNPEAWQGWRGYDKIFYFRDYSGALFDLDVTDTLTKNKVDYLQNTSVDYLRGLCYFGLENWEKSIEYFNKFVEDERIKVGDKFIDETAFLYLGIIDIENGRFQDAIKQLQRGFKYEDGFAEFHYYLALIYCELGATKQAKAEIEKSKLKFEEENYRRAYRYENIRQLYLDDIEDLEEKINL